MQSNYNLKIISHRGNLTGIDKNLENNPKHIDEIYKHQIDVEIDVWNINSKYYLGHDEPIYEVSKEWLIKKKSWLWCHAKNQDALYQLLKDDMNCFWHENDRFTLTSKCIPWCFPNNYIKNGITVVLEKANFNLFKKYNIFGICTDYPLFYKQTHTI
jgi:hypothetical protein